MRPSASSPAVARRMAGQPRRDTAPEVRLRKALFARGLRYRVGYPVPNVKRCTIDIAFPGKQVAVFVDGCFWHRCPEHGTHPKANSQWWSEKLLANQERDRRVDRALMDAGWRVARIWEHQPCDVAVETVEAALASNWPASAVTAS